jgi:hypothetical protein
MWGNMADTNKGNVKNTTKQTKLYRNVSQTVVHGPQVVEGSPEAV